MIQIIRIRIH